MSSPFKPFAAAAMFTGLILSSCGGDKDVNVDEPRSFDFVSFVKGLILTQTGDKTAPLAIDDVMFTDSEDAAAFNDAFFK